LKQAEVKEDKKVLKFLLMIPNPDVIFIENIQIMYRQFRVIRVGDFALNPRSLSYF